MKKTVDYFKRPHILLVALCFLAVAACDDIIEKDISDKKIILNAPGDSVKLNRLTITFWWEPVNGVEQYQIQVVSPSFDAIEYLWLDSISSNIQVKASLDTGRFEWRVRGVNGSYETAFSAIRSFVIDSLPDISLQEVLLTSPADGTVFNSTDISFKWQDLSIADSFLLEVKNSGFFLDSLVAATQVSIELEEKEAEYTWSVTPKNAKGYGRVATVWNFRIDLGAPEAPQALNPKNDSIFLNLPVVLSWSSPDDKATDKLFIYTDEAGETLLEGFPVSLTVQNFSFTEDDRTRLEAGTYYWSVVTVDEAGNESEASERWAFTLNE